MAICHAGIEIISPILKWDSPQLWVPEEKHMVVVDVYKAFPEWLVAVNSPREEHLGAW
jgi:hypothetical protein